MQNPYKNKDLCHVCYENNDLWCNKTTVKKNYLLSDNDFNNIYSIKKKYCLYINIYYLISEVQAKSKLSEKELSQKLEKKNEKIKLKKIKLEEKKI
jgi:hypothetical protein